VSVEEILAQLQRWRKWVERPAWVPRVAEGDGGEPSKLGGLPWLSADERWPHCGRCASPMHFFLQLDLARLPSELEGRYGDGLLQLFHCTDCDGGWSSQAFDASQLVRVVHGIGGPTTRESPRELELFPARTIVSWEQVADLPESCEHENRGIQYTYDFTANTVRVECPEVCLDTVLAFDEGGDELSETIASARGGDKLAGWPAWVQDVEYPSCPRCRGRMQVVLQLDSEDNVPYMWGDVGTGHITQCPQHLDVLAFARACH
jgi:uncharacterized protein YwqG